MSTRGQEAGTAGSTTSRAPLGRTVALAGAAGVALGALGFAARVRTFYEVNAEVHCGGLRRRYLLRVPDGPQPEGPRPLVVVIHGFLQSPAHQRMMSRWDDLASREGFLTVYPLGSGVPPHWPPADSPRAHRAPDQVAFVSALVDEVGRRFEVDRDRVYASGMSNGGGLAALLALELPEQFAAVGVVAGLYPRPPLGPGTGHAVPLIAFHGGLDRIVPIDGGTRRLGAPVMAVEDWIAAYADACGCTGHTEEDLGETVRRVRYTGGRGDAEVEWYRIADAGHTWPGGVPLPEVITGPTSPLVDATRLTWDFFAAHPLPRRR